MAAWRDAFYHFGMIMTPRDRERSYLASLLTGRDPAKEVRAFGLAGFLRSRHDRLYDERIAEMRRVSTRRVSTRQLRGMAVADLASSLTIAIAIAGILWLAVSHHLALSSAAAGAAALVLLGQRLAFAGQNAGMLQESAMFIDDFLAFSSLAPGAPWEVAGGGAAGSFGVVAAEGVTFSYPGSERVALRDGYQTLLGPAFIDGTDLSTGQWQRVTLARTFFRDAPLVILDEPTAALDAKAEHDLFGRIGELLAGRSVLLISHRFSTVRAADRIYVLREGRVVESGTHEELLAADGTYAEMFTLQASPYQ